MSKKILAATVSLSMIALALSGCKTGIEDPKGDKLSGNIELIISEPVVPVDEGHKETNVDTSLAAIPTGANFIGELVLITLLSEI